MYPRIAGPMRHASPRRGSQAKPHSLPARAIGALTRYTIVTAITFNYCCIRLVVEVIRCTSESSVLLVPPRGSGLAVNPGAALRCGHE
jgi:hypothetical protein